MKTSDITIVIQGAMKLYAQHDAEAFARLLRHTRKALPGARLLLSTWEGSDVPANLDIDELVLSRDPGALAPLKLTDTKPNNINRQLVSSHAGIKAVRTPYAMKMRTDCHLNHASFIDFHEAQLKRDKLERRVVTGAFFTLDTGFLERIPYHVSDWWQFARTEVLRDYWSAPLLTPEAGRYYEQHPHAPHSNVLERRFRAQFAVEQYIAMHYARQLGYTTPALLNDVSPEVVADYGRFLRDELLVLDPWQCGVAFPKYEWVNRSFYQGINNFTHLDWLGLTGQPAFADEPPELLAQALARRRRLKDLARRLFLATRPMHGPIFEDTRRGRAIRRVLMRSLAVVRAVARA